MRCLTDLDTSGDAIGGGVDDAEGGSTVTANVDPAIIRCDDDTVWACRDGNG